ncbi:MAG: TIGR00296 family protein [Candidatus Aenigmatarchaeota archaeon]|nr:MAG: TIGR00296 family protein [Candidatus Aenigmarchaeota archaeon]
MREETKKWILNYVRDVIEKYTNFRKVEIPEEYPEELNEKRGVFVTLKKNGMLRGCMGIPYPVYPLIRALTESAKSATEDPRFPILGPDELEDVEIEVTVLTKPELIEVKNPEEYPEKIEIGKDGLIIEAGYYSGLLLPQVPVEQGWGPEEFLSHLCLKAGLDRDFWRKRRCRIYKFQGEIISE